MIPRPRERRRRRGSGTVCTVGQRALLLPLAGDGTTRRSGSGPAGGRCTPVDWENLKFSLKQRERRPNVTALRLAAERFGRIVYARAYADWQDPVHSGDPASLYIAGLEPVYVLTKRYAGEDGEVRIKNSVDVKLAADCIEASHQFPNIATYIIVSGDHGFLHVVNTLRPHGKRVVVIGVSWTTAAQLTDQADVVLYYDLDVERALDEGPTPVQERLPTRKIAPSIAQTAETAIGHLGTQGAPSGVDARQVANVLELMLQITREYREDRRPLSVSLLGQELQKRMNAADYQRLVKGRARTLAQALAAHRLIKLLPRDFIDWIYLADEPDELVAAEAPLAAEPPRYDYGGLVYADLSPERRIAAIAAVSDERTRPGVSWLTFNRVIDLLIPVVDRERPAVRNLVNNMVAVGVLQQAGVRHGTAPDTGVSYSYVTLELDMQHPDVRQALKLG